MELRHLRYFTTLTEELHFGRAALRLHIAQPALSKQIANLERELGVVLFERNRRRVELTPSGRLLLPEAKRLVELSARFQQSARRIREGLVGTLRLGYTRTVADSLLPDLLRLHHRRFPSMLMSLRETTTQTAIDDVRDGIYDAAFLRHVSGEVDLELMEVKVEPAVLAVPIGHPLATAKLVHFADLKGEPLVMMTRDIEPQLYDHAIALCAEAGFEPTIVHEADSVQTTLSMVSSELGVAVVTSSAQKSAISGVVYVALTDPTPTVTLSLVYRKDHVSPSLAAFLQSVQAMKKKWEANELAGKP
ncbi:MAG: transcriptional regulator, LysR family [Subtercola sp.]|jgi:DNA-binding transcriptional LysR family regulator|nr:transcriptional regulator, LysR family [Subtercola sp.]